MDSSPELVDVAYNKTLNLCEGTLTPDLPAEQRVILRLHSIHRHY